MTTLSIGTAGPEPVSYTHLFSFYTCKDGGVIFIGMTGAEVCKRGYPIIGLPVPGTGDPDFPEGFTGWMINSPVGQRVELSLIHI